MIKKENIEEIIRDMENGVYNFCKDGECSQCGTCCSNILSLSTKEVKKIERYIEKHNILPVDHREKVEIEECTLDMLCPFLDTNKEREKCLIYEVRPEICKNFICCSPPSERTESERKVFMRNKFVVNMLEKFYS